MNTPTLPKRDRGRPPVGPIVTFRAHPNDRKSLDALPKGERSDIIREMLADFFALMKRKKVSPIESWPKIEVSVSPANARILRKSNSAELLASQFVADGIALMRRRAAKAGK